MKFDPDKEGKYEINLFEDPSDDSFEELVKFQKAPKNPKMGSTEMFNTLYRQGIKAKKKEEHLNDEDNRPECLNHFDESFTVDHAIDKLCYENAKNFALKYFPVTEEFLEQMESEGPMLS